MLLCRISRVMAGDETHASHVGRQCVDLFDSPGRLQTVLPSAQIENLEFVRVRRRVFRMLQIDASHPVSLPLQEGYEMVPDEAARTRDQHPNS